MDSLLGNLTSVNTSKIHIAFSLEKFKVFCCIYLFHCLCFKNLWHRPRMMDTEGEVTGRSTLGSPRKVPTKFPHNIPKMDTLPRSRPGKMLQFGGNKMENY